MIIIAILMSIADIITTIFITQKWRGRNESVGTSSPPLPLFIGIKIFATIGLIIWTILMYKWKIKDMLITVIIILLCSVYLLALINNVTEIIMFYKPKN